MTGGTVEATSANIGENVTITLTPDETHVFGSLKVDGQAVTCQADENGVYIYTFTATKSSYQIEAVFADGGDLAITVTGVHVDSSDLTIEVSNGSVTKEATLEGGTWTVSRIAYGTYTITVTSKTGGYTVLTQEVNFEAGSESATVEITADNYGDNRKYELQGENDEEYSGGVLAEDLGSTESFVFKGFLGIKEGGDSLDALKESGHGSFGAGLRFIMSDGNSLRIAFVANNGTWSIRCYWQASNNSEHDNVTLTMDDTLKNYVSTNGGVNIIAVAEKVGGTPTVTIFVECAENTWQQLGTYANGNVPLDKAIEQVTITKMWIRDNPNRTSYAEGTLSFGTTDTGIPANNVLTETIDLDEKGTEYWEHYSAGTGSNNSATVTDSKADAADKIVFDPSSWDRYETRPYGADNAQAFTGTSRKGALNSNGYVFRDRSNALTATVTLAKGDTAVKVYTGTWISNCQFTITLTDDTTGEVVGGIVFTVTNGSATYETVFTVDTSGWADDETKTFTLSCSSDNTLKLMAIAIS